MNLVNLENVGKAYGAEVLLDRVSLGLAEGERVGIVGRNGGGKTTLVSLIAGFAQPDEGRVTHARGLRVGFLAQHDELAGSGTVRDHVLGEAPEHEWAGDRRTREVTRGLLGEVELDAPVGFLSGGERRRVALAGLLVAEYDLLVLDEPTNHLDIEAVDWLGRHLAHRGCALAVVTHDRWFLDEVCTQTWEVAGGPVHRYDGGYAAYVLARAERARLAAAAEERRRNLLRKELAWLRRGPPARTSKPKFRPAAASALIGNEPPPRDTVELVRFARVRLGKIVYELDDVVLRADGSVLFDGVTWRLGPGERVGVVGRNGSGKTSLLRLLAGDLEPDAGRVRRGKTVRPAYLSQELAELDPARRVLEAVEEVRRVVRIGQGRELSAGQLLERFGFRGERQWTPIGELSGGERRRLQLMRLLMTEPNVLLLDEPTNDLDIDTLTELEDLLDGWPGSMVVVAHDRYFLERVADHVVALLGDGRLSYLGGGVEEYLARRRADRTERAGPGGAGGASGVRGVAAETGRGTAAERRAARKELARLERRLERLTARENELQELLAAHASDYEKLMELDAEFRQVRAEREGIEDAWLALADAADG
ncbi:MAG: ATP-binding cassette domain-containing protein [Streptosporangiales bacterium]|nr:ATP-binding cassette domain-containing protein [Streptosporangiales bacterium]